MFFKKITLQDWRQYGEVSISLDRRLTVFTGANGAGKSVVLHFVAAHMSLVPPLIASLNEEGTGFIAAVQLRAGHAMNPIFLIGQAKEIPGGRLIPMAAPVCTVEYSDDTTAQVVLPFDVTTGTFEMIGHGTKKIDGLYFSSFAPSHMYEKIKEDDLIFSADSDEPAAVLMLRKIRSALGQTSEGYCWREIKTSLVNWLKIAEGNEYFREQFSRFEQIAKDTLPNELAFERFELSNLEVRVVTKATNFLVDAASGGIGKLVSMLWQLFLLSTLRNEAVIALDEPENHLHPGMQQSLMESLLRNFPEFQFVVATHSPFMVTGVKNAIIYAFKISGIDLHVTRLDETLQKGLTPDEVLREVLGLPFTMPLWAAAEIESLVQKFTAAEITPAKIEEFIDDVESAGLEHLIPFAIRSLREKVKGFD